MTSSLFASYYVTEELKMLFGLQSKMILLQKNDLLVCAILSLAAQSNKSRNDEVFGITVYTCIHTRLSLTPYTSNGFTSGALT